MTYEEMARHRLCGASALTDHFEKLGDHSFAVKEMRYHLRGFFPEEMRPTRRLGRPWTLYAPPARPERMG